MIWCYKPHSKALVTNWGRGDLYRLTKCTATSFPTRHTLTHASTRLAHATNLAMQWVLPLASNCVAWLVTMLGSSPEVIDLDEPSKIVSLALPTAPLHHYALSPIAITRQNANVHANPNDLHTNSFAIFVLRTLPLTVTLVPTSSYHMDHCLLVV